MSEEALQVVILIFLGIPVPIGWMIKLLKSKQSEIEERRKEFD